MSPTRAEYDNARAELAAAMRERGATYAAIAAQHGYASDDSARRAVKNHLRRRQAAAPAGDR